MQAGRDRNQVSESPWPASISWLARVGMSRSQAPSAGEGGAQNKGPLKTDLGVIAWGLGLSAILPYSGAQNKAESPKNKLTPHDQTKKSIPPQGDQEPGLARVVGRPRGLHFAHTNYLKWGGGLKLNKRAMMALGCSPEYHWNQIISKSVYRFSRRSRFKLFSIYSPGSHFVQQRGMLWAIFVDSHLRNIPV